MQPQILVPLDGSALAETVLPQAGRLARATGSGLTLLRIVARVPTPLFAGAIAPRAWEHEAWEAAWVLARDYLQGVAEEVAMEGLMVQTDVLEGDPAQVIVTYARAQPAVQIIAMATHGRTGALRWVRGSMAAAMLPNAPTPLLLVHAQPQWPSVAAPLTRPYRTILIPLDGSRRDEGALAQAQALAAATGATLVLLCVIAEPDLALIEMLTAPEAALAAGDGGAGPMIAPAHCPAAPAPDNPPRVRTQQLRAAGFTVQEHCAYGPAADAILQLGDAVDADLIVMGMYGGGGVLRLVHSDVVWHVVAGARRPVLLVRDPGSPGLSAVER